MIIGLLILYSSSRIASKIAHELDSEHRKQPACIGILLSLSCAMHEAKRSGILIQQGKMLILSGSFLLHDSQVLPLLVTFM